MNLEVSLNPQETSRHLIIKLSDLNLNQEQWDNLEESEKKAKLNTFAKALLDQPEWIVYSFVEVEEEK